MNVTSFRDYRVHYYQRCAVSYVIANVMCRRLPMLCFVVCNYDCFRETCCLHFTQRMEAEFSTETMLSVS
jgi:hypothetical protein